MNELSFGSTLVYGYCKYSCTINLPTFTHFRDNQKCLRVVWYFIYSKFSSLFQSLHNFLYLCIQCITF